MKVIKLLSINMVIIIFLSGCVVTKESHNQLLSDYAALDREKQELEKELSDVQEEDKKKIAQQKNRIEKLEQEIEDLQVKYDEDMTIAASRQAEISKSLEVLKEESSEETQYLLQQIAEIQEKCDADISARNEAIDAIKAENRENLETLNNRLDHEIQSNKLVVEKLLSEIEKLEALTAEQDDVVKKLATQADQMEQQLKEEIEKGEIRLKRDKTKTIINIDNSILFDSGKVTVKQDVKKSLIKIAKVLNDFPENDIQIEGHTDDIPINTPKFPSNWALSSARALAVLRFFVEKTDMDSTKLSAVAYGEYRPLVSNDTIENRRLNRRVAIVIVPK